MDAAVPLSVSSPRCAAGFLCNQVYFTKSVVLGRENNAFTFFGLLLVISPVTALCRIKIYRKPIKS